jgi:hypothetical protein
MTSLLLLTALVTAVVSAAPAEKYANVVVGQDGRVDVVTESGRHITPPNDGDQVGADQAAVAPDHQSVGWLSLYPNCCTSYPLPLKLMVLHDGHVRTLSGESHLLISFWAFQGGGKQVAFKEETAHGGMGVHYELWDVASGKRVADYTPEYDQNGRDIARPNEPNWVQALDAAQAKQP